MLTAAGQIAQLIREIQSQTQQVVGVVAEGTRRTEEGVATVGQAREAFEHIGSASVAEESSASAEQVSASTQQTSASAQDIAASAQSLASTASQLDELVRRFKVAA